MIVVERSVTYLNNIKLDSLKGFGEKRYSSLKKSNLSSIADLLRFFPKKHIDRSKIKKIVEINDSDIDKEVTMIGNISKVSVFTTRSRLRITTLSISDNSGNVKAKWFGPQYIESRFKEGDDVALSGKPDIKKTGSIEFKNPTIEKFADIEDLNETGSLIPIYPKIDGISSAVIRKALKEVLQIVNSPKGEFLPGIKDVIPQKILQKYLDLMPTIDKLFILDYNNYIKINKKYSLPQKIQLQKQIEIFLFIKKFIYNNKKYKKKIKKIVEINKRSSLSKI